MPHHRDSYDFRWKSWGKDFHTFLLDMNVQWCCPRSCQKSYQNHRRETLNNISVLANETNTHWGAEPKDRGDTCPDYVSQVPVSVTPVASLNLKLLYCVSLSIHFLLTMKIFLYTVKIFLTDTNCLYAFTYWFLTFRLNRMYYGKRRDYQCFHFILFIFIRRSIIKQYQCF